MPQKKWLGAMGLSGKIGMVVTINKLLHDRHLQAWALPKVTHVTADFHLPVTATFIGSLRFPTSVAAVGMRGQAAVPPGKAVVAFPSGAEVCPARPNLLSTRIR
jgi:hypothetical protein